MEQVNASSQSQSLSTTMVEGLYQNRKILLIALLVLILAAAGSVFFSHYRADREMKAADAIFSATEKLNQSLSQATAPNEGAAGGAPIAVTPAILEKLAEPMGVLKKLADENKSTAAAYEAYMQLGNLQYEAGAYAQAAPLFEAASQSIKGRTLKAVALYSLGYAKENLQDYKGALKALQEAIPYADEALRPEVLLAAARVAKQDQNESKAKEYYEILSKEHSNTPQGQEASRALGNKSDATTRAEAK
jgi:tetratricopeptide (TPR) repeat protein